MNKLDLDYQNLLKDILDNGVKKETRNGGTISVFGRQIRHNMKDGFPLLTTKKMPWKTIVTELLWFLRGDTNIKYLVDNNCHIWDGDAYKNYCMSYKDGHEFYEDEKVKRSYTQEEFINKIKTDDEFGNKWGELGPIYGKQWRSWQTYSTYEKIATYESGRGLYTYIKDDVIDQIQNLINDLKTNPDSRRLMVNAWNVGEINQMVLPPCHYGFQVYTRELSTTERMEYYGKHFMKETESKTFDELLKIDYDKLNIPTRAISLMWNQRSVDTFLGLPFNIASYGLLLEIIAKEVNMVADELIGNLGDVHLYSNHIEQAKEQIGRELTFDERALLAKRPQMVDDKHYTEHALSELTVLLDETNIPKRTREPFPLPTIEVSGSWKYLSSSPCFGDTIEHKDIKLVNYQSHPTIKAPLSN